MHMHMNADDVALLWTQSPRFIEIMRSGTGFQHPHYFFSQTDKLVALLNRLCEDTATYGPSNDYIQAHEVLMQLLNESQLYGSLTREQLRHLEPEVRAFVDKVQGVDAFVAGWDENRKQMSVPKPISRKRGREEDGVEVVRTVIKRRKESCGGQAMELQALFNGQDYSPWIQNHATQPVLWQEHYFD